MILIVCGEDGVFSRNYFNELQQKYKDQGNDILKISPDDILNVNWDGVSKNLFGLKQVYTLENLNKNFSRIKNKRILDLLEKIGKSKEAILLIWEDGISAREIKFGKFGQLKEFKPSKNVFKLLDSCFPG